MSLLDNWNRNAFSIYSTEEQTVLKIIEKIFLSNKEVIEEVLKKTDLYGDHKGTWQGLSKPTLSNEGAAAITEKHIKDISLLKDLFVNVKDFGAKGDGVADDTQAIQNAINSLSTKGGTVYFPSGKYNYTQLYIKTSGIALKGSYSATSQFGSTLFCTSTGTNASIIVCGVNEDKIFGGGIYDLNIFGSDYEHKLAKDHNDLPLDRKGILIKHTSFFNLENVTIYGFSQGCCIFDGAYDSNIIGSEFVFVGEGDGYALEIIKTSEYVDIANALKFVNCKWEFSKHLLKIDKARNILFNNCKLEVGFKNTTDNPILITNQAIEINFNNCFFGNDSDNNYMIKINNKGTSFNSCQFSAGTLEGGQGAKWLDGNYYSVTNSLFVLCKNNDYSINLGEGSLFVGNRVNMFTNGVTKTIKGTEQNLVSNNIIHDYTRGSNWCLDVPSERNTLSNNVEY